MLRRQALRHFAPLSRPQIPRQQIRRIGSHNKPPPHNARPKPQVKIVKAPFFSWHRQRKFFFYTGVFYVFFNLVLPNFVTISISEIEDGAEGEEELTEEEIDEAEDGLFIPFGWPKKQQRTYYKASDPEWKEFVKFSKEKERHLDVQKRLVSSIRSEIASHPHFKRMVGKIDQTKGRFMLEIVFPDGPPQDYEVPGIEITDNFIAWSVKTIDQKEYAQWYRTLVPTATIAGSWASFRYQFDMQANKVRSYFGLQPKIDPEVAFLKAHLTTKGTTSPIHSSPKTDSPTSAMQITPQDSDPTPTIKLPDIVPRGEAKPVTLALFMRNFKKNQSSTPIEPPRGSIVVTGLVEVIGCHGSATLDVSAAYDSKRDEFVVRNWRPRRIRPKAQRPKGGA